ncbi:MAG: LacI family DNA-binding transcriptional regulator [Treponemataceae bacterium]
MTVKEIARLAGVSIGTVDRVLHGRGRVSTETKAKIEAIIRASGFVPNPIARRLKRNRQYRFMVLMPHRSEDSGYWGQAYAGISGAADEIQSYGVETICLEFSRHDRDSFSAVADKVVAESPDAVLFSPVMPEECRDFIDRLKGSVPYAFFDADLPGTFPLYAIGQDPYRGGYLAGRLVQLFSRGEGSFAVIESHSEDYHIKTRRDGFRAYANQHGFRTTVAENSDLTNDMAACLLIETLQREEPDLAGIFVTNSSSHRVASAVRSLRRRKGFVVVGYDLVPENERLLRRGEMDAIISQRPETQGYRALSDLYRSIVLGRPIARHVEVPIDLFLKENLPSTAESSATGLRVDDSREGL